MWDESKHPRDDDGKFTDGSGTTGTDEKTFTSGRFAKVTTDDGLNNGKGKVSARFEEFKSPKTDIDIQLFAGKKVVELSEDNELSRLILSSDKSKYKVIMDYIKKNFGGREFTLSDGRKTIIDNSDAKELSHKADAKRTAEITLLDELVKNAVFYDSVIAEHNKFSHFRYYVVQTKYKNETNSIYLNVGVAKNDGKLHLYAITPKK